MKDYAKDVSNLRLNDEGELGIKWASVERMLGKRLFRIRVIEKIGGLQNVLGNNKYEEYKKLLEKVII
jgi:hypothetical protein